MTGAIAGSFFPGPGNAIGTAIGALVGLIINYFTDVVQYDGKSARDWAKEGTYAAVDSMEERALAQMRLLPYY